MKLISAIFVFLTATVVSFAQNEINIRLNTEEYPSLGALPGLSANTDSQYPETGNYEWDALHTKKLFLQAASAKAYPLSTLKYFPAAEKLVAYGDLGFTIFTPDKLETTVQKQISAPGKDIKLTEVYCSKDNILYATADLNRYCESGNWKIESLEFKSGKTRELVSSSDKEFAETSTAQASKCPLITQLCSDDESKNTAFNLTDLEFENYCYKLYFIKGKKVKEIDNSCSARLVFMHFVSENELFYVLQNHKANTIEFKLVNSDGKKLRNLGCYAYSGIKGHFKNLIVLPGNEEFIVSYEDAGEYIKAYYKFSGERTDSETITDNDLTDLVSGNVLLAYDYNIFTLYKPLADKALGTLYHKYDIFDINFGNDGKFIYSADESGIVKKWDKTQNENRLFILENTQKIYSIPTKESADQNKFDEFSEKNRQDFKRFSETQARKELLRKKREADYIKMFSMNDMAFSAKENLETDKLFYAAFDFEANVSVFDVSVFHIEKQQNYFKTVEYCGRCISEFGYHKAADNMLIAVLPDGKIGYLGAEEFKRQTDAVNGTNDVHTFSLKTYLKKDTEFILKEIFNN